MSGIKIMGLAIIIAIIVSFLFNMVMIPIMVNNGESPFVKLTKIIMQCPYSIDEYKENSFDCSNMAAMLDDWLEYHGYECWIIIWKKANPLEPGHAMVLVNGQLVEPTTKSMRTSIIDMADGTYSRLIEIIDEPTQLDHYMESEWIYPKGW